MGQYNEFLTKYSGPAIWYNQLQENYQKTQKFLEEISPYRYLEARNKLRMQSLRQKKQEMIDQENDESFKGFILANKLKNEYEKNVRDVIGDEMKDSLKKNNNTQESDKVNIEGDGKKKRKSKKKKVGDDTNSEVLNTEETKKKKKSKKKSKEKNDDQDNTLNTAESKKKKKSKKTSG